jgi:hypothetical protein
MKINESNKLKNKSNKSEKIKKSKQYCLFIETGFRYK